MKKLIIAASCLVLAATLSFAAEVNKPAKVPFNELPKEEQEARIAAARQHKLKRTGGEVAREGSQKGKILFVNTQKIVPEAELTKTIDALVKRSRLNVQLVSAEKEVSPMTAGQLKMEFGADIVVFLTDCEKCSIMLLNAPEDGWAIVNAKAVTKDARNDVFKAARLRKEMQRAFYSVAGAMNSNFPNSLMKAVRDPKDLDKLGEDVPMDAYGRTIENLKSIGVTPTEVTTYLQACKLGWAPAPTNEYQKAIWEKINAKPTNPIKIKPGDKPKK